LACINGGIAEAFYGGVPEHTLKEVKNRLGNRLLSIMESFCAKYIKDEAGKNILL